MKFLNRLRLPNFAGNLSSPDNGEVWYDSILQQGKYKATGSTYPVTMQLGSRFNDYALGRWYPTQVGASTTATATASRAFANPFFVPRAATLSGIALEIATAWTTTGNVRLGLYSDDGSRLPINLITDYGIVTATAGVKTWTTTTALVPGCYWLVAVNQGGSGTTTGQYRTITGIHDFLGDSAATPTFLNSSVNCYYSDTGFTGALPASFGTVAGLSSGPRFAVRFSS